VGANLFGTLEQFRDAVRARVRRNVEVFGGAAEQEVAYATAHQVCLVPGRAQPQNN